MTMMTRCSRTVAMQKIFLYNTHGNRRLLPRHCHPHARDKVRPDKLREAVEQALLRFPHDADR